MMKDLNGGGGNVSGRGLFQSQVSEWEWRTKTIMAFNENNMPGLDVEDAALVERLLVIPHRSRFYPTEVPADAPPFSFPADPDIKTKFDLWAPYMLLWLLPGVKRLKEVGFTGIPESCRAFKQQLLDEKDVVREFLDDAVEKGCDHDFVLGKEPSLSWIALREKEPSSS